MAVIHASALCRQVERPARGSWARPPGIVTVGCAGTKPRGVNVPIPGCCPCGWRGVPLTAGDGVGRRCRWARGRPHGSLRPSASMGDVLSSSSPIVPHRPPKKLQVASPWNPGRGDAGQGRSPMAYVPTRDALPWRSRRVVQEQRSCRGVDFQESRNL